MINKSVVVVGALSIACVAQPAHSKGMEQQLGKVHFETSCNPAAQKLFHPRHALSAFLLV